jgi:hypothetical protein
MDRSAGTEQVTTDIALGSAVRLLRNAELETDLKRMERMEKLADSWIAIAALCHRRETGD